MRGREEIAPFCQAETSAIQHAGQSWLRAGVNRVPTLVVTGVDGPIVGQGRRLTNQGAQVMGEAASRLCSGMR